VSWKSYFNKCAAAATVAMVINAAAFAQQSSPETLQKILDRLDTLEKQNQELLTEIQALRQEVKTQRPEAADQTSELQDRVEVNEQRVKEQAETKVSASQRLPVSLAGMLLFDSFYSQGNKNPIFFENYGDYSLGTAGGGATLNQSLIGFDYQGPHIFGGGQVHGSLSMDFYRQADTYGAFRIRRGYISFDWSRRSLTIGQDKSLIAPFEPTSFARVGEPALSGAGNLWLWRPQIRYEERVPFSPNTQAIFQASLFQTDESYSTLTPLPEGAIQESRPALQARVELRHQWNDIAKFSVGVAGHESKTHLLGRSVNSRVISADFSYRPMRVLDITATLLHGENFANLGGVSPGVTINENGVIPIHGNAGWVQVALPVTKRLTFDLYAGQQLNDAKDLTSFDVSRNLVYAGNVLYRIGTNVVLGFEGAQQELQYLNRLHFSTTRYDATVAYLF
jgi:hypothetical protein